MRRFACNQKGCCCSGWDIPFRLEDFLRLHEHLPEEERKGLTKGIQLVLEEEKNDKGEAILHSLKLEGVGDDAACRFLENGGGCGATTKADGRKSKHSKSGQATPFGVNNVTHGPPA